MKRLALIAFSFYLLLFPLAVHGQPTHYSVGPTVGTIIATGGSPFNGRSPTAGVDLAALWQQGDSATYWHRFWGYPLIGVRMNYAHIWNSPAGDRIGLAGTLQGPIWRHLGWTYSVGLSGYTKPYSVTHDAANIFIGSHLNCLIDIGLVYDLPLSGMLTLTLAGKIVHSSNGYLYKPNHGLNYLQLDLGLRTGPVKAKDMSQMGGVENSSFTPHHSPFLLFAPAAVMSRYDPPDAIRYHPAYTFQFGYIWHPHPCFAYGATFDFSYNFSHRSQEPRTKWPVYPAISAFGDAVWGPLVLRVGLAHYLGHYPLNWEQYYERVALYYRMGRHLVGVGMKVHNDHIDYIEWSYAIELW